MFRIPSRYARPTAGVVKLDMPNKVSMTSAGAYGADATITDSLMGLEKDPSVC